MGRPLGTCYSHGFCAKILIFFVCKKRMQTPSRNSPPGWRIIIIGPRCTSNCVAKVHRVARAPRVLLFSFAPSFRLDMFKGITVDALLLLNFLATILTSKLCAYMRRILGMKGVNFFSPFINLSIQTSQS